MWYSLSSETFLIEYQINDWGGGLKIWCDRIKSREKKFHCCFFDEFNKDKWRLKKFWSDSKSEKWENEIIKAAKIRFVLIRFAFYPEKKNGGKKASVPEMSAMHNIFPLSNENGNFREWANGKNFLRLLFLCEFVSSRLRFRSLWKHQSEVKTNSIFAFTALTEQSKIDFFSSSRKCFSMKF